MPARVELRRAAQQAAVAATDVDEFVAYLQERGYRVELRRAPSGDLLGYKLARPGDRDGGGGAGVLQRQQTRPRPVPAAAATALGEHTSPADSRRHRPGTGRVGGARGGGRGTGRAAHRQ